ncbi:DUF2207 domain-containing protein [Serpentinicella sp. ANB-PHB4]|uniref:DUF2207 domain-containing protein n=1 Tax=Serpentinicella sp. ANB-PHB4 TaxID=3074076 RepID=UPI00285A0987|nr:DUF2207 domain-containing protein [Serpentinicella sp. ANB-PHB4]MDR5659687.1 DUF2207 domain-containing protein [Serpentinicella sp. ANB-PHB4]
MNIDKKLLHRVSLLLLIFFFSFSTDLVYADRSLEIQEVNIIAEVFTDGTMAIQEERTIYFDGEYNGFYQDINMDSGVEIRDVVVKENNQPYEFNPSDDYGPPGTYLIREYPNRLHVDWSIEAQNEQRTFVIEYVVENEVKVHNDVAELTYQFIGNEWEDSQRNVRVHLTLPEGSLDKDLRAWGHGPLDGNVTILNEREVIWEIDRLPRKTFLEGRVTFTPSSVMAPHLETGFTALPDILETEERLANRANRLRTLGKLDILFAAIVFVLSIILSIFLRKRYAKPYPTTFDGDYYRELPANYSPAELGILIRKGTPNEDDFTATIIDLAYRGYIRLDEYDYTKKGILSAKDETDYKVTRLEKEDGLLKHERKILEFLFEKISTNEKEITFKEIEKFAKKKPEKFQKFWSKWIEDLSLIGKKHRFFDQSNTTGIAIGTITGIILGILGITALITGIVPIMGIALIASGVIVLIVGITIHRRSPKGEEDYVRWMAFKKFLLHFSEMERHELPSLVIWEHYMVYAVTLGVAKEVMKQLQVVFPNLTDGNRSFGYGWYYYSVGSRASLNSPHTGFQGLTSSINNSITAARSHASSGSGSGGGFSGGGGFGGGGGGGGGR